MVSPNVNKLLREAQALSDAERQELRELLDERAVRQESQPTKEQQLDQELLAQGVILRIPPEPTEEEIARFRAWKPVKITGKPLSETIIEDRR